MDVVRPAMLLLHLLHEGMVMDNGRRVASLISAFYGAVVDIVRPEIHICVDVKSCARMGVCHATYLYLGAPSHVGTRMLLFWRCTHS